MSQLSVASCIVICVILLDYMRPSLQQNSGPFTKADLQRVKDVQRDFCPFETTCKIEQIATTPVTKQKKTLAKEASNVTQPTVLERDPACCLPCSCDITTCHVRGTCCASVLKYLPSVDESISRTKITCEYLHLRTPVDGEYPSGNRLFMYTQCAADYRFESVDALSVKNKCENSNMYTDLYTKVAVTNTTTLKTYKNIYCALCNNLKAEDVEWWIAKIECEREADGLSLTGLLSDTIVTGVMDTPSCNIIYVKPADLKITLGNCRRSIKECNVTGLWETYDPVVEAACHAYTSVYDFRYKNIFCYQCNEISGDEQCIDRSKNSFISFSLVLNFNGNSDDTTVEASESCLVNQIYDPYKKFCRDLKCRFPKKIENGTCVNFVDSLSQAGYTLYMKLIPTQSLVEASVSKIQYLLGPAVHELVNEWQVYENVFKYQAFYKKGYSNSNVNTSNKTDVSTTLSTESRPSSTVESIVVTAPPLEKVKANTCSPNMMTSKINDQLENNIVTPSTEIEYLLVRIILYFNDHIFKYHRVSYIDNIINADGSTKTLHNNQSGFSANFTIDIVDFSNNDDEEDCIYDIDDGMLLTPMSIFFPPSLFRVFTPVPSRLTITDTLNCPLVTLESKDFNITVQNNGMDLLSVNGSFISSKYFTKPVGNNIVYQVCADTYLAIARQFADNVTNTPLPKDEHVKPQGILSLVCTCLSILCCVLTMLTYGLFKELRTQPGINNMALATCLIIAQALFQFGVNQSDNVSSSACQAIGVLVHFFWVMVLFWMNVCSFHMFRVFNVTRNITSGSNKLRTTSVYCIYTFCASILFVVINIVVSTTTTDDSNIGYGGNICYITQPEMIGYVFAIPVGLVIIANLILFLIVIIQVTRLPTVKTKTKKERNFLKIYAKLSTITGITWIFGFVFLFTGVVALEYIFIIFSAGQGVFIFLSFVCNSRVLAMYRGKLCHKKTISRDIQGKSSKTGTTSFSQTPTTEVE